MQKLLKTCSFENSSEGRSHVDDSGGKCNSQSSNCFDQYSRLFWQQGYMESEGDKEVIDKDTLIT